jgi:hypothetical protein
VGTKMREAVQQIRKRENTTPPSRKPFEWVERARRSIYFRLSLYNHRPIA